MARDAKAAVQTLHAAVEVARATCSYPGVAQTSRAAGLDHDALRRRGRHTRATVLFTVRWKLRLFWCVGCDRAMWWRGRSGAFSLNELKRLQWLCRKCYAGWRRADA